MRWRAKRDNGGLARSNAHGTGRGTEAIEPVGVGEAASSGGGAIRGGPRPDRGRWPTWVSVSPRRPSQQAGVCVHHRPDTLAPCRVPAALRTRTQPRGADVGEPQGSRVRQLRIRRHRSGGAAHPGGQAPDATQRRGPGLHTTRRAPNEEETAPFEKGSFGIQDHDAGKGFFTVGSGQMAKLIAGKPLSPGAGAV